MFKKYVYTAVPVYCLILALAASVYADEILGENGDQSVVSELISALQKERQKGNDASSQVKSAIMLALGRLKNPDAARVLVSSLADSDLSETDASAALISIGNPAVREISEVFNFNNKRFDDSTRSEALTILRKIGSPQAMNVIANQIGTTPHISRKAARELLSLDETTGLHILSEKLESSEIASNDKMDIIRTIHRHAPATQNTRKILESALTTDSNDADVRLHAMAALAAIGVTEPLKKAIDGDRELEEKLSSAPLAGPGFPLSQYDSRRLAVMLWAKIFSDVKPALKLRREWQKIGGYWRGRPEEDELVKVIIDHGTEMDVRELLEIDKRASTIFLLPALLGSQEATETLLNLLPIFKDDPYMRINILFVLKELSVDENEIKEILGKAVEKSVVCEKENPLPSDMKNIFKMNEQVREINKKFQDEESHTSRKE